MDCLRERTKGQHGAGLQARESSAQLRNGKQRAVASTAEERHDLLQVNKENKARFHFLEAQTKHTEGRLPHPGMGCYCLKARKVTGNLGSCFGGLYVWVGGIGCLVIVSPFFRDSVGCPLGWTLVDLESYSQNKAQSGAF